MLNLTYEIIASYTAHRMNVDYHETSDIFKEMRDYCATSLAQMLVDGKINMHNYSVASGQIGAVIQNSYKP